MAKGEEEKPRKKIKKEKKVTTSEIVLDYPKEDILLLYQFKYDSVKETALVLAKGITFYLAIMAALFGYVFSQDLDNTDDVNLKSVALFAGYYISWCVIIAAVFIAYGVITGILSIKRLLKGSNPELFKKMKVSNFFLRGVIVVIGVLLSCLAVLVVFYFAIRKITPDLSF